MSGEIYFEYFGEKFHLEKSDDPVHSVKINGVNYAVIGPEEKLKEICEQLKALSNKTKGSMEDLLQRLTDPKSQPATGKLKTMIEKRLGKAKEAEDLTTTTKPYLKRQMSIILKTTEREQLEKKSSAMWDCTGRAADPHSNGYVYTFKIKDDCNNLTPPKGKEKEIELNIKKKRSEHFPGVDPSANGVKDTFESFTEREIGILKDLGYTFDPKNGILTLPDREALLGRWKKISEEWALEGYKVPSLDVVSSEGIANDLEYVEAFFTHDALVSSGEEFIHDSLIHLLPALKYWFVKGEKGEADHIAYKNARASFGKSIMNCYRKLLIAKSSIDLLPEEKRAERLAATQRAEASLGMIVDIGLANGYDGLSISSTTPSENMRRGDFPGKNWERYMEKRFGSQEAPGPALAQAWSEIDNFVKAFDADYATRRPNFKEK